MSRSSVSLDSAVRDYWGQWNPSVEPYMAALQRSQCHSPRWIVVPSLDAQIIPAGGKITFNFHVPAGSILWGLMTQGGGTAQLTDVGLGHALFQEPYNLTSAAGTTGQQLGNIPSVMLLPCPWPVTGDGLFTLEIWGPVGQRVAIFIGSAEVSTCQA